MALSFNISARVALKFSIALEGREDAGNLDEDLCDLGASQPFGAAVSLSVK